MKILNFVHFDVYFRSEYTNVAWANSKSVGSLNHWYNGVMIAITNIATFLPTYEVGAVAVVDVVGKVWCSCCSFVLWYGGLRKADEATHE